MASLLVHTAPGRGELLTRALACVARHSQSLDVALVAPTREWALEAARRAAFFGCRFPWRAVVAAALPLGAVRSWPAVAMEDAVLPGDGDLAALLAGGLARAEADDVPAAYLEALDPQAYNAREKLRQACAAFPMTAGPLLFRMAHDGAPAGPGTLPRPALHQHHDGPCLPLAGAHCPYEVVLANGR